VQVNGIEKIAITKLDVLDDFDEIRVCIGYELNGKRLSGFPTDVQTLDRVHPLYKTFKGWKSKISDVRRYSSLPPQARRYVDAIAALLNTKVWMVSVGARRDQTLLRR
jgi:adenylosuccinate synthase